MEAPDADWKLIVSVAATLGYAWYRWQQNDNEPVSTSGIICCSNKECIRCQRYRQVQKLAQSRYPWIAKEMKNDYPSQSLERIKKSVQNPTNAKTKMQAPTVLMLHNLPSQVVVTRMHQDLSKRLRDIRISSKILQEALSVPENMWSTNDSPKGSWKVLPFLNQGCWVFDVCKKCPETFQFIESLPGLLDQSLFGNAMISKITPGTFIEPHCGPTNIRHRMQMSLQIPSRDCKIMSLQVSDSRLEWGNRGEYFIFDDSFVHSVTFSKQKFFHNTNEEERIVLIVDLWHPSLTAAERSVLQRVYPPPTY